LVELGVYKLVGLAQYAPSVLGGVARQHGVFAPIPVKAETLVALDEGTRQHGRSLAARVLAAVDGHRIGRRAHEQVVVVD